MRGKGRYIQFVLCLAFVCGVVLFHNTEAFATGKVISVVDKTESSGRDQEQGVIYGKDSKGNTVWKYTTGKYIAAQLVGYSYSVKGNKVYIFDTGKLVVLTKASGKVVCKSKQYDDLNSAPVFIFDKKGNVYAQGATGNYLYKFSKKGKLVWKVKAGADCFSPSYPYKMSIAYSAGSDVGDAVRIIYVESPFVDFDGMLAEECLFLLKNGEFWECSTAYPFEELYG